MVVHYDFNFIMSLICVKYRSVGSLIFVAVLAKV